MTHLPKNDYVNAFKPEKGAGFSVTPGIHDPSTKYEPSNPKAWGPRGAWQNKQHNDLNYERQVARTHAVVGYDGFIRHELTWESRGKEQDSTFRPDPKNCAPRADGWKPAEPLSW